MTHNVFVLQVGINDILNWPGSSFFTRCTYFDMQIKMLNSPSICENESCTELEEEMLN